MRRTITRALGGLVLAAAAFAFLRPVAVPVAAAFALGAGCFAWWRRRAGVAAGFAFLLASAWLAHRDASVQALRALAPLAAAISAPLLLGLASVGITAAASTRGWPSRRFLGAWLGATGALVAGLALCASPPAAARGSVLVTGGLADLLGAVPWFAWAPLLLRHERPAISLTGAVAMGTTAAITWWVVPRLPDAAAARAAAAALGAIVVPWAAWMARRQWKVDRRCARSHLAVVACGLLLLVRSRV